MLSDWKNPKPSDRDGNSKHARRKLPVNHNGMLNAEELGIVSYCRSRGMLARQALECS